MAPASTMTGARAKVMITNPNPDANSSGAKVVGVFSDVSFSFSYDLQPVYVLGNEAPVESVYTSQEPVRLTCNGFRSVGNGPFAAAGLPTLSEILTHEYLTMELYDRATGAIIGTVRQCRPQGFDSSVSARQLQTMSLSYMGLLFSDETATADKMTPKEINGNAASKTSSGPTVYPSGS